MPSDISTNSAIGRSIDAPGQFFVNRARLLMAVIVGAAIIVGYFITSPDVAAHAAAQAGPELTRLMRGMAAIKTLLAIAAGAAVFWRLGAPASLPWFAAYSLTCAAMASGPGVIWNMEYLRTGALLLHGGLFASVVLLWRDPAMSQRLEAAVAARRLAIRLRTGH